MVTIQFRDNCSQILGFKIPQPFIVAYILSNDNKFPQ